jgi:hypothetical protein
MRTRDKPSWTDAFAVTAFGSRVGVRVLDPSLIPLLMDRLPPNSRVSNKMNRVDQWISLNSTSISANGVRREYCLPYSGKIATACSKELEYLLEDYDSQLRFALAQFSKRKIFVHGGAIGWNGKVAVFPGSTHSGKSHLVAELIKAGADYFSDEHVVLDDKGFVHPWLKPLSIRDGHQGRQRNVWPEALGARVATKPLPVSLVLSTYFRPAAIWNPQTLTPAVGALELVANAISARKYPERAMSVLAATAERALIVKSDRPDAKDVLGRIFELLESAD